MPYKIYHGKRIEIPGVSFTASGCDATFTYSNKSEDEDEDFLVTFNLKDLTGTSVEPETDLTYEGHSVYSVSAGSKEWKFHIRSTLNKARPKVKIEDSRLVDISIWNVDVGTEEQGNRLANALWSAAKICREKDGYGGF